MQIAYDAAVVCEIAVSCFITSSMFSGVYVSGVCDDSVKSEHHSIFRDRDRDYVHVLHDYTRNVGISCVCQYGMRIRLTC